MFMYLLIGTSVHVPVDHRYVFLAKMPIQSLFPFLIALFGVFLLLLSCMSYLFILDINPFRKYHLQISSHIRLVAFFVLLMVFVNLTPKSRENKRNGPTLNSKASAQQRVPSTKQKGRYLWGKGRRYIMTNDTMEGRYVQCQRRLTFEWEQDMGNST